MEPFRQTIAVGDGLSEVGRIQEELAALWERMALPADMEGTVSLALEEALSNVLRHSKAEGGSRGIEVVFQVEPDGFEFEISDSTTEYNPLARPDPDVTLPLEKRRPGGLGVYLVKQLADEVSYERREGKNRLRFLKRF
jgi:anti-sigma regulatory factor (Ser/Thr protein kinase)